VSGVTVRLISDAGAAPRGTSTKAAADDCEPLQVAACTKLTIITGEGASEVISHPAPVFWMRTVRCCWPGWRSRAHGKLDGGAGRRLRLLELQVLATINWITPADLRLSSYVLG
jgi:hypothetical protein